MLEAKFKLTKAVTSASMFSCEHSSKGNKIDESISANTGYVQIQQGTSGCVVGYVKVCTLVPLLCL